MRATLQEIVQMAKERATQEERERIIKLIKEVRSERLSPEEALVKGWRFDEPSGIWWLPQDTLIALIKGENK